jgi:hypothetical protein
VWRRKWLLTMNDLMHIRVSEMNSLKPQYPGLFNKSTDCRPETKKKKKKKRVKRIKREKQEFGMQAIKNHSTLYKPHEGQNEKKG